MEPLKLRDSLTKSVLEHDYETGPLLILAGPGTGKTYSLRETIRKQLQKGYPLECFFEATLTNAAADDFRKDVKSKISSVFENATTLHHRAKGILHNYAIHIGIDPGFMIIDDNSKELIMRDLATFSNLSSQECEATLESYQEATANVIRNNNQFSEDYRRIQSFYKVLDWYDVVLLACQLLQNDEQIRNKESNRYKFLLIDEYQDLNPADQLFVKLLLNERGILLAVGDDDQSIYSNRYADSSGIIEFQNHYPTSTVMQLPVSSRLPSAVISASNSLVTKNEDRMVKDQLISIPETDERANKGFVISVNNKSDKAEKQLIFDALYTLLDSDVPAKEILVLCSCRALGLELINSLGELDKESRIPIRNDLNKKQSLEADEYLLMQLRKFIANQNNNLAARFIINEIADDKNQEESKIVHFAINKEISIWQALETYELNSQIQNLEPVLDELRFKLESLDKNANLNTKLRDLVTSFQPLSHLERLLSSDREEIQEKSEQEDANNPSGVRFITLHSSKGLEGDFVFIPFMEEAIGIPGKDIEEHRRLLYVALTRAKVGVVMSWSWSRKSSKRFNCSGTGGDITSRSYSPFIGEMDVPPNLQKFNSVKTSPESALEILQFHSHLLKQQDV